MSYNVLKLLHVISVFTVILPLGGIATHVMNGGTKQFKSRKMLAIMHGIGLLGALVTAILMASRLYENQSMPGWIYGKVAVWLILGAMPAPLYRMPLNAKNFWWLILIVLSFAAVLSILKPF